ncbi:hypothetical protein BJX62DRAFT_202521 [Aspergillus germanicus]
MSLQHEAAGRGEVSNTPLTRRPFDSYTFDAASLVRTSPRLCPVARRFIYSLVSLIYILPIASTRKEYLSLTTPTPVGLFPSQSLDYVMKVVLVSPLLCHVWRLLSP